MNGFEIDFFRMLGIPLRLHQSRILESKITPLTEFRNPNLEFIKSELQMKQINDLRNQN